MGLYVMPSGLAQPVTGFRNLLPTSNEKPNLKRGKEVWGSPFIVQARHYGVLPSCSAPILLPHKTFRSLTT